MGKRSTTVYDSANRAQASIDELGNRATQGYDAASRPVRTINALGKITTTIYDSANRAIALINPLGNRWSSTYDAASRVVRTTNPLNRILSNVYDASDRVVVTINSLGFRTTTTYDSAGQAMRVTDANNKISTNSYDAAGRVIAAIDANANRTTQIYNSASQRIALVDARANRTSFLYDDAGRQIWQMDALTRRTTAGYDVASRQVTRMDARGNRTTYSYDSANRPIGPRYPDGTRATFVYDPVGRRTLLQDWTGRTTSTYDDAGRLRSVTNPAGKRITYTLDAISRRTLMIEPGRGRFSYAYDDADRITQLVNTQSQRTSWAYDSSNRVTSKRMANTDRTSYTYDDADEILRVANVIPGVTTISSFSYKYDSAGNRLRVVEAIGDTVTWSYDNAYQLTNEKRSGANSYNVSYLYDPAGNRLRKNDSGVLTTSSYDAANQLIKQNAAGTMTIYTFDANGNQLRTSSSIVTTYTWDFENRLTKIRPSNLLPAINTMTYDGDGKRVRKDDSSGTAKHIWDGANILEETDQNDSTIVIYTEEPALYGNVISQVRGSTSSFYSFDGLGSTDRLSDISGLTITDSYIYNAFGGIQATSGTTVNPFRFIGLLGYYYDGDFLDYFVRFRIYDPKTGRWTSRDPLGIAEDANAYRYVRNSSLTLTDPLGLIGVFMDGAGQLGLVQKSTIRLFYQWYNDKPKEYYRTPLVIGKPPTQDDLELEVNKAAKAIQQAWLAARKKCKREPIDLFGWSRGAVAVLGVLDVLKKYIAGIENTDPDILKQFPITVRFVGLIDPVATYLKKPPDTIPNFVKVGRIANKDGKVKDFILGVDVSDEFKTLPVKDNAQDPLTKEFHVSHAQSGFDPTIRRWLLKEAKDHGVPLEEPKERPK